MKTIKILIFAILLSSANGFAQSSIVAAGGNFTNGNIQNQWHLGEITAASSTSGILMEDGSFKGTFVVELSTWIEENNIPKMEIYSYPNPVTDLMFVTSDRTLIVKVTSIKGDVVKYFELPLGKNVIVVEDLTPGIYLVSFTDKVNQVVTKKIVKQ